jgi:SAM-dependent methyltransferase
MAELPDWAPEGVEITVPNAARVYDYALGGYHNFAADREFVERALRLWPDAMAVGHASRAFLRRSVRWLVGNGIRQFLDLGSGIPTLGNVHQIAQAATPDARVVYVDIDPVAVAHSRAILADNPLADAIRADLRDAADLLADDHVHGLLDVRQPIAVLFNSVLHYVLSTDDVIGILKRIRDVLVRDSYIVIAHGAPVPELSEQQAQVTELFRNTTTHGHLRTSDELRTILTGMELVPPGIVPVTDWRPDPDEADDIPQPAMLAVVARQG